VFFSKFNYITNYIEKRAITLPNVIGNVIDFNYFSITLKALHISNFLCKNLLLLCAEHHYPWLILPAAGFKLNRLLMEELPLDLVLRVWAPETPV